MYVDLPPLNSNISRTQLMGLGSEQTNGMHQYVIWTALEMEGLGCNLQHYNPLIDTRLATEYGVPESWELKAQLVFGKPTGEHPEAKPKNEISKTLKVFGK